MLNCRLLISALCLHALVGCGVFAEKPAPAPRPTASPAPAPMAKAQAPLPTPQHTTAKPQPATQPGRPPHSKPAREQHESPASTSAAREPEPAANKPNSAPFNGPKWLRQCSTLEHSPTGVQCDANTLLAQPSDTVRVYVREPSLARNTPGGKIQLREGLPRLYRFFVIP